MSNIVTPLTPEQTAQTESNVAKEGYIHRDLVAIDQTANVLMGGLPDETISSRAARAARKGRRWGKTLSTILDFFERNHGAKAQAGDVERAKEVIDVEVESGDVQ